MTNRHRSPLFPEWGAGISLLILIAVTGCATKGPQPSFSANTLPAFSAGGEASASDRWWKEFQDEGLDREVNRALGGNFDLATSLQRLRAARAVTRRVSSDFFPDVDGLLTGDHSFRSGRNRTRSSFGLDASWQVDLWGRIQSRVDAERLRSEATKADYHAVALVLSAEVARTWFLLIESYAQLDLLKEQLVTNLDGLKAVEGAFANGGQGGSPNVLRQRQLVESTLEQFTVVKADIEVLEHQLAVLTGQPPQEANYEPGRTLPDLPPQPATRLPCELLYRRPDVRADYLKYVAAEHDLDAAVTDQYPRLDLTGSFLNSAEQPEMFFRNWALGIGGQLFGPILDGGQRQAEVERTRAVRMQRYNEFRQTVLIAMQDVEDGLALERYQEQRIQKLQEQLKLAKQASAQLSQQFITGDARFLDILSANQSQQRLQRTMLSARLELILIRIGLYLSLAGDFDTRPEVDIKVPEDAQDDPMPRFLGPRDDEPDGPLQSATPGRIRELPED